MPSKLTVVLVSLMVSTAVLIFWLWLVIVPSRVGALCPEECNCDPTGYYVECSSISLTAVPVIHLTDVKSLWLYESNITSLEKNSFVSLSGLVKLSVIACGLRTIELGAFKWCTKLKILLIGPNDLSEIIPGTFDNLNSLEHLAVFGNRLEFLYSDLFSGLVNLNYISLAANNLHNLHADTFLGLPNLRELRLSNNPGLQVPTDRSFINSHSLSQLVISNCNISSLSVETFANVSALQQLDLSDNKLRTIDINILRTLPKLSELYLYRNRLQCDCQLQEVWRWCDDRNIETVYSEVAPECDTPSEVEGIFWGVLEKGQCLEGNIQYYGDYNSTRYIANDTDHQYSYENDVEFFKKYQIILYAFPFIFGTIANVILLIIIICNKDMRTVPNMYILNLATSDMIYLTILFLEAFANRVSTTWLDGEFICRFLPFCSRMSICLSAYSVAVFSFQRYRVTAYPMHVRVTSRPKWRGIVATICGVWIVAALFAVPPTLSEHHCEHLTVMRGVPYYKRKVIFELLVSCVLPLCVVSFCYIMTARHLVVRSRAISEGTQNAQLQHTRRYTAKIVVGLTVVFVISYVPYHVFWTYFIYNEITTLFSKITNILDQSNYKLQYTYQISTCFLLINSCLNPVALFCTSSPFRQHLKRYLTFFCKTNSPPTDFEITRRN